MKDIQNMTPEQLRDGNIYCMFGQYWVLDSFENTLGILAERDLSVNRIESSDISGGGYFTNSEDVRTTGDIEIINSPRFYSRPKDFFGKDSKSSYSRYYYGSGYYGSGDDFEKYSELDAITSAFSDNSNSGYYYDGSMESEMVVDDALLMLLNNATPIIINEKPIAIVHYTNSTTLYIRDTPENRALLKKHYYGD